MLKRTRALLAICVLSSGLGLFAGKADAEVTLVYSDWQLAENVWNRSLREAFAEFEKANPDIKIKYEPVALGQRDTRYGTALRAGKGPDISRWMPIRSSNTSRKAGSRI